MKRMICLLLSLILVLSFVPAVSADVIFEPEDTFYWDHRGECQYHNRFYYADGSDTTVEVYRSPVSAAVVERVKNGEELWISYTYADENDIRWGYCENFQEDWAGWVPMDYLLLKYDSTCFQEEFSDRIIQQSGALTEPGDVRFWNYPGSADCTAVTTDEAYLPEYQAVFTDDAGRSWGYVGYYMGTRNVWICLDDPAADYQTLYAEAQPQQVTHPVKSDCGTPIGIKPAGPSMGSILSVVCVLAILSGGFLWITRKKK